MMHGKWRKYVVPDMKYEDGSVETFEAVESDATLEDLFRWGQGNAREQREAHRDRALLRGKEWAYNEEPSEPWAFEPEHETKHRWAWNYVRHSLTDYDNLVERFSWQNREYTLCESCQVFHAADEPHGLDINCEDCMAAMDVEAEACDDWVKAIRLGIARWAKQCWPELDIDEEELWGRNLKIPPEPYQAPV